MRAFVLGVAASLTVTLTGCVYPFCDDDYFDGGGSHHNRGRLSDVMGAAAGGSGEPLPGPNAHESSGSSTSIDGGSDDFENAAPGPVPATRRHGFVQYSDRGYAWQVSLDAEHTRPYNGEIESMTRFAVAPIAYENDRNFAAVYLGGGIVNLKDGNLPGQALKGTDTFTVGFSYRRYLNDPHVFISPYLTGDVSLNSLSWSYREPVDVGNDTIHSDGLNAAGGFAGLGVALNRKGRVSFFGEAGVGAWAYIADTYQGFENDVFHDFGYFSVRAGLTMKF